MKINESSPVPIYLQIAEHIRGDIAIGVYRTGEGLPSIRSLAVELRVSQNTVHKAYGELESEGLIVQRRGLGMFVSKRAAVSARASAVRSAKDELKKSVSACLAVEIDGDELRKLVSDALERHQEESRHGD